MQYCTLEKEGFLGTFYKGETPSEKPSSSWAEAARGVPSRFCSLTRGKSA